MIVTPSQLTKRAELYHQLGSTISAGVPLLQALEMAAQNPISRSTRGPILEMILHIQAGCTFSESVQRTQGWLPSFDVALISAGEKSGTLDSSFKLLSTYYSTRARLLRDMIGNMLFTVATLHVFLIIFPLGFLINFAQGLFNSDHSLCIPFIVEKVVVFGSIYGGVFFLIYASQGQRDENWRGMIERFTNLVPVLRTGLRHLAISRLSGALEALIRAGISIFDAWQFAASASGSPALRRTVAEWKFHLEAGTTPSELVNRTPYFPQMFANLYNTGEESGKLDDTLHRLQHYYQEEGFRNLQVFTRIFNGLLYALVAGAVAYNVISFWSNYYSRAMNSF